MSKRCPRCGGGGRIPLNATEQAVYQRLRFDVPILSAEIQQTVGLSHQRIDGALVVLEREGLATRLPRTGQGFEWVAGKQEQRKDYSRSRHAHSDFVSCAAAGDAGHPPWPSEKFATPPPAAGSDR